MTDTQQTSGSDEEWTCGMGLAAHARIPASIASFLESLAENLHAHLATIDTSDAAGTAERAVYVELSTEYDDLAARLAAAAGRMRSQRDLPAARHHQDALADPRLLDVFERFVALETELAELLTQSAERDRRALDEHARDVRAGHEPGTILRTWRGSTRAEDGDRYLAYLRETGVKEYRATPGNRGVFVARRERDGRAEFLLLTLWESMEAVERFAGSTPERAVFYPEDDAFLVEKDEHVDHYEVEEKG